jgi:hypothetical protein
MFCRLKLEGFGTSSSHAGGSSSEAAAAAAVTDSDGPSHIHSHKPSLIIEGFPIGYRFKFDSRRRPVGQGFKLALC